MSEMQISCPNCGTEFELNKTLAAPLIEETRRKVQEEVRQKEESIRAQQEVIEQKAKDAEKASKEAEKKLAELDIRQEQIDEQVADLVEQERLKIAREAEKKAKERYDQKLAERDEEKAELEQRIETQEKALSDARKEKAEFLRKQRELDEKLAEADAELEKRVNEALEPMRAKARQEAEEKQQLTLAERDKKIDDLQRQLREAIRRAEQGSQQLQGEVQELDLEQTLATKFPMDSIEPVAKGEHGGDVLQKVRGPIGEVCGTIIWESKRTKNWNDGWLTKLRKDQRAAKAEVAIIVSEALPAEVSTFETIDGVLVVSRHCVIPLAVVMRNRLIELYQTRKSAEGQQTKMELLYQYVMGPEFRQRVEGIVEAFSAMQEQLFKEKKATMRLWAKREKQLDLVMTSTTGMWGDLQGIAGKSLHEIEGLVVPLLEEGDEDTDDVLTEE